MAFCFLKMNPVPERIDDRHSSRAPFGLLDSRIHVWVLVRLNLGVIIIESRDIDGYHRSRRSVPMMLGQHQLQPVALDPEDHRAAIVALETPNLLEPQK